VAAYDQTLGIIGVAQAVKPSACLTLEILHGMGMEVSMITGDNARTAEAIARQAGIDRGLD
jgi:Cu+-exporting ATPase